jgi:uncharacterized protein
LDELRPGAEVAVDAAPKEASHRLCAVTREELDKKDLIRFVADPAGQMVPDLGCDLPGRGVWVTAERALVAKAVAVNAFAKSLKRQVKADPALPERVEALMERRVAETLSLANKAGLVTSGFSKIDPLLESGTVAVLLHGSDAAEGGREKLDRKFVAIARAKGRNAPIVTSLSTTQLSLAMGRSNVVHAALIQGGVTQRFLGEAERLMRYRSGSCASPGSASPKETKV